MLRGQGTQRATRQTNRAPCTTARRPGARGKLALMGTAADEEQEPDYGPGGYLPPRAAQRARKIVLRERMGLQWPIAAGVAAVIVALGGVLFLLRGAGPPGEPFVPVARLNALQPGASEVADVRGTKVLLVRAAGGVHAFVAPHGGEPRFCDASGRLEGDGRVWTLEGRLVGGAGDASSLARVPVTVSDGVLYVDPTAPEPAPEPSGAGESPQCTPA